MRAGRATAGWIAAGSAATLTAGVLGAAAPPASATVTTPPATRSTAPATRSTAPATRSTAPANPLARKPFEIQMPRKVRRAGPATTGGALRRGYSTLGAPVVALGTAAPAPAVGPRPSVLPTFTKSFTSNGSGYTYRMVGSDPAGAATTTTVPNALVRVSVRVDGRTIAPSASTVSTVTGSGLFTARTFPGSTGQYGDAFLRTQFWSLLGNGTKNWHVTLAAPTVEPWLVLDVPPSAGAAITVRGVQVAVVDVDWFDAHVQDAVTGRPAGVLTQLLAGNVVLCKPFTAGDSGTCGIGGYHSATADAGGVHTYSFQSYLHGSVFGAESGFHDLGPMSHELAEWFADPYVDNVVPHWRSELAPQYGCLDELETGDPVVGSFLTIGGLTYSDEAYVWWFARTVPSPAWQHRYTWLNTFTTYSPSCTPS